MKLLNNPKVAQIIDGQHRIAGLEDFEGVFQLNISLFIDMDVEDQAMVFATINDKQTKVNRSIVADLFSLNKKRSPQKTSNFIVRLLNSENGSPFLGKIKILGTADDKERETITQATFSKNLLKYISKDPITDRDRIKRGKKISRVEDKEEERYFLRNLFLEQEDVKIAKIVWNYFSAVQQRWPNAWDKVEREMILNKSTGFIALMRFFKDAYLHLRSNQNEVVSFEKFKKLFDSISIEENDMNRNIYVPGSGGQSQLYYDLKEKSGI
jgi:DGQHR domain-containing protein